MSPVVGRCGLAPLSACTRGGDALLSIADNGQMIATSPCNTRPRNSVVGSQILLYHVGLVFRARSVALGPIIGGTKQVKMAKHEPKLTGRSAGADRSRATVLEDLKAVVLALPSRTAVRSTFRRAKVGHSETSVLKLPGDCDHFTCGVHAALSGLGSKGADES